MLKLRSITALDFVLNDTLTAEDHVGSILTSCSSSLYVLRVLRDHGLPANSLREVFLCYDSRKDTLLCPGVVGPLLGSDRARLDAFLRRSKKYGYCADDVPTTVTDVFAATDQSLFKRVLNNQLHACSSRCCLTSLAINYARANTTCN